MMRQAASSSFALRSSFLVLTISKTWSLVTLPTLSRLGIEEPLAKPAAFFNKTDAGGDFRIKLKERSAYTVITTGKINPALSLVFALNSLQNPMMFTPCAPSAGPTGGAGLAAPAGSCNFISPTAFFDIISILLQLFLLAKTLIPRE